MQTSGSFPGLSDGVRKIVTPAPSRRDPRPPGDKKDPPKPANSHRRGGFVKHTKGGK